MKSSRLSAAIRHQIEQKQNKAQRFMTEAQTLEYHAHLSEDEQHAAFLLSQAEKKRIKAQLFQAEATYLLVGM